jgi:hypothetical protein
MLNELRMDGRRILTPRPFFHNRSLLAGGDPAAAARRLFAPHCRESYLAEQKNSAGSFLQKVILGGELVRFGHGVAIGTGLADLNFKRGRAMKPALYLFGCSPAANLGFGRADAGYDP